MEILTSPLPPSPDVDLKPAAATTASPSLAQTVWDSFPTEIPALAEEITSPVVAGGEEITGTGVDNIDTIGIGLDEICGYGSNLDLANQWDDQMEVEGFLASLDMKQGLSEVDLHPFLLGDIAGTGVTVS